MFLSDTFDRSIWSYYTNNRCTILKRDDTRKHLLPAILKKTPEGKSLECMLGCNQPKWQQVVTDGRCLEATVCRALTQAGADGRPFSSAQVLVTVNANGQQLRQLMSWGSQLFAEIELVKWQGSWYSFQFFVLPLLPWERMNLLQPSVLSFKILVSENS